MTVTRRTFLQSIRSRFRRTLGTRRPCGQGGQKVPHRTDRFGLVGQGDHRDGDGGRFGQYGRRL